jgi:hypothetical protein
LKSILSDVSIAISACFLVPFAWKIFFNPLTLSQSLFLSVKWVSCKQQIIRSSFLIQLVDLCLLMVHTFTHTHTHTHTHDFITDV